MSLINENKPLFLKELTSTSTLSTTIQVTVPQRDIEVFIENNKAQ